MKHIIILGDGMADEPIAALGNKTPLQVAHKPYIDQIAQSGVNGLLETVPDSMHPGSEIANMSVLGYDVEEVYEGRGVLEAASMNIEIAPDEIAFRCNLICIENEKIKNHSAGHISNEEAGELIDLLNEKLGNESVRFHKGVSYRNLLILKNGNKNLQCTPPHDVPNKPFAPLLVQPKEEAANATAKLLNELIAASIKLLENHPINVKRKSEGKDPANAIWPWSPGERPLMQTLKSQWGVNSSAVISAVDLVQGIGVYAGMEVIKVNGATGLYNTNYAGKAQAAWQALQKHDFVYLHIEAPDEAGHEGDFQLKVKTIEDIDSKVVKPIWEAIQASEEEIAIAILPDHPTPCELRTHTRTPVPFAVYKPNLFRDDVDTYDEHNAEWGELGLLKGNEFIKFLLAD
ncbi:cofactor-independent phosphoglycerate mutase [Prolixibacteraceae bacterium JC049]|nr:cofactor-independent phosphoglycerate mutase [Prolixibacteraceae bacterium JC049]